MTKILILLIIFNLTASFKCFAENNSAVIKSEIIKINKKKQTINFIDKVTVEKAGDSMLADKMRVEYYEQQLDKSNNGDSSKVKEIVAMGNVKIFSREFVASGNYGYYNPRKNIFKLEGDVIVNNGTSIASGKNFIYDLENKKGIFLGQKQVKSIKNSDNRVTIILDDQSTDSLKDNSKNKNLDND